MSTLGPDISGPGFVFCKMCDIMYKIRLIQQRQRVAEKPWSGRTVSEEVRYESEM